MKEIDKEKAVEMVRLLKKESYLPLDLFNTLNGLVSLWATELVIFRTGDAGKEILLKIYDGEAETFHGIWHIPGGYNLFTENDIQETCSRLAKIELGADVSAGKILGAYKWKKGEHPYGKPLSLYIECSPTGVLEETQLNRFFPINDLPQDIVSPHLRFIKSLK
ncbi:MAG TPA: hypothetical protein VJI73_04785 [Candidatus Paceibacterota bacterium]